MIRYFLIFILLALVSAEPIRLSLSDALKIGMEKNFDIQIQQTRDQKIKNNQLLSLGALLPNIDAKAGANHSLSDKTSDSPTSLGSGIETNTNINAGIEMNWTLFDGFKMFAYKKVLDRQLSISEEELKINMELLAVQIIQNYYEIATNQFFIRMAEKQLEISKQRMEKMEMRKELGASTERDFLNARVAYNADRSLLHNRNLQHFNSVENLKMLLGYPKLDSFLVNEEIHHSKGLKDVSYWIRNANEKNKSLSLNQQLINLEELNVSIAKSSYWPQIIATGSYALSSNDISIGDRDVHAESNGFSIGIQARLPLFAGFRNLTAAKNAKLERRAVELNLNKVQLELESLVRRQYAVLVNAHSQISYEKEAVELSKRNLDLSEAQLKLGGAENLEFREAQLAYFEAEVRLAQAKFQYQLASVELERLSGMFSLNE